MKGKLMKFCGMLAILTMVLNFAFTAPLGVKAIETLDQSIKVTALEDVEITATATTAATGDNQTISIRRQTTTQYTKLALIKFSLADLQNVAEVKSAKVGFYAVSSKNGSNNSNNYLSVHEHADSQWSESTAGMVLTDDETSAIPVKSSSDTNPAGEKLGQVNVVADNLPAFYEIDITEYIKKHVDAESDLCSISLNASMRAVNTIINSSENEDVSTRPYLMVEYSSYPEGAYSIKATESVSVCEDTAETNAYDADFLVTQCANNYNRKALVKFATNALDTEGKYVKKATLKLYAVKNYVRLKTDSSVTVSPDFNIRAISSEWNEKTITWATAPNMYGEIVATSKIPGGKTDTNEYVEFDVTAYVGKFINETPGQDISFMGQPVFYDGATGSVYFSSERSSSGFAPVLEVELEDKKFVISEKTFNEETQSITALYKGDEENFTIIAVHCDSKGNIKNITPYEPNLAEAVYTISETAQKGDVIKFIIVDSLSGLKPLEVKETAVYAAK